jgi:hypothetical protein
MVAEELSSLVEESLVPVLPAVPVVASFGRTLLLASACVIFDPW